MVFFPTPLLSDIKNKKSGVREFGEQLTIHLGLTAVVFFLFSLCHQNAHPNKSRRHFLGHLAGMNRIFRCCRLPILLLNKLIVEFMELLFDGVKTEPDSLLICVMLFSCLALFVPCVALLNLSKSNFGARLLDRCVRLVVVFGCIRLSLSAGSCVTAFVLTAEAA